MPYHVTFIWDKNDPVYDQFAFGDIHPNGDLYMGIRRNDAKKQIIIERIKSGTGVLERVEVLTEGVDFVAAGAVNLAFHPAGHIVLFGIFMDNKNFSPGYITLLNKCPRFTPNQNYVVTTTAEDTYARQKSDAAVATAQQAINIANSSSGLIKDTVANEAKSLVKKFDAAVAKLPKSFVTESQARDIAWSLSRDRIYDQLTDPKSPLMNKIQQAALAALKTAK